MHKTSATLTTSHQRALCQHPKPDFLVSLPLLQSVTEIAMI